MTHGLAGSLVGLICGETGFGVGAAVDQVQDIRGFIQRDGMTEVLTMHRGGVGGRPVAGSATHVKHYSKVTLCGTENDQWMGSSSRCP